MIERNGDAQLSVIREKVEAGQRLSFDDGLFLYDQADLFTLGELANVVRQRKNGNFAYYNVNTHLNPTNVCVYRCTFCAFRADLKSAKGYVMTDEQILERAANFLNGVTSHRNLIGVEGHVLTKRAVNFRVREPDKIVENTRKDIPCFGDPKLRS